MALYYKVVGDKNYTTVYNGSGGRTIFLMGGNDHTEVVERIQADGDELETIRAQCTGLPMPVGNTATWTGVFAEFIANNVRF